MPRHSGEHRDDGHGGNEHDLPLGAHDAPFATIFATQLVSTRRYGPAQRRGYECGLGAEILTMQHEIERAGMAKSELANRRLQPLGHLSILEIV